MLINLIISLPLATCLLLPSNFINPIISISNLFLAKKGKESLEKINLEPNLTRKIIHISTAPSFMTTWKFYNEINSKNWASFVPIFATFYMLSKKGDLAKIISRSGNENEILKGQILYTIVLSIITYFYWIDDPIGIIAMIQLAVGDGFADIIGRNFGNNKWKHNSKKSIEGTIGFFITSSIFTQLFVNYYFDYNFDFSKIIVLSLIASLIETFSEIDDNISVPISVIMFNLFL